MRLFDLLRSVVFAVILPLSIPPAVLIALCTAPLPARWRFYIISHWAWFITVMIRVVLGIRHRVIGLENLPANASVILAKHQSAWETIVFQTIFPPHGYVLKKELLRIPIFGWGLAQMPSVPIDRSAGKDALRQVVDRGKKLLAENVWVMVFPEGTRVAPGERKRYKVGGATLAVEAGVPVVPVAQNAGEFWRRNAFMKRPGEVIVSIGPAIDTTGLDPEEVNRRAEAWIEGEMQRRFPHLYTRDTAPEEAAAQPASTGN